MIDNHTSRITKLVHSSYHQSNNEQFSMVVLSTEADNSNQKKSFEKYIFKTFVQKKKFRKRYFQNLFFSGDPCRLPQLSTMLFSTYLVEEELQLLVGQVDADLFEAVHLKLLKAKDV